MKKKSNELCKIIDVENLYYDDYTDCYLPFETIYSSLPVVSASSDVPAVAVPSDVPAVASVPFEVGISKPLQTHQKVSKTAQFGVFPVFILLVVLIGTCAFSFAFGLVLGFGVFGLSLVSGLSQIQNSSSEKIDYDLIKRIEQTQKSGVNNANSNKSNSIVINNNITIN